MRDQQWILDTISALNSEGTPASIDQALQSVAQKLDLDRCILRYREPGTDVFRVIAEYHHDGLTPIDTLEPEMDSRASLALVQRLLDEGHVQICDATVEPGFSEQEIQRAMDWHCRAILFLPLRFQGAVNGMIIANQGTQARQWSESDRFIVQLIGETALSVWLRNRSVQALYQSRQRYQWAVEISNDALFDWDIQGEAISYSPRFFQMVGRPFVRSMPIADLLSMVHPDDVELLLGKMRQAASGDLLRSHFELRMMNGNGDIVWLLVGAAVVEKDENGHPARGFGTLTDITTFKKTLQHVELLRQDAEKANLAKSEFLARMSHEVRTPLNAITGMLHLLQDSPLNAGQLEKVLAMQTAGKQLLTVLNDILDISRIESGKLELEHIPFDPDQLLRQLVAMFAAQAHEKKIDLVILLGKPLPASVLGDPARLMQILSNLLSNALKFTRRGQVVLKIDCRQTGELLAFECEVCDTGVGMTDEQLDRLFNPFVQAELNIARQYGGSGLGLSICKSLVELMGGHIMARSEAGVGSRFLFTLQLQSDPAGRDSPSPVLPAPKGKDRILCRSFPAREAYQNLFACQGLASSVSTAAAGPGELAQALARLPADGRLWIDAAFEQEEMALLHQFMQQHCEAPQLVLLPDVMTEPLRDFLARWPAVQYRLKPLTPGALRDYFAALSGAGEESGRGRTFRLSEDKQQHLADLRVLLVEDNRINQMVAREMLSKYGVDVVVCDHGKLAVDEIYHRPAGYFDLVLMDLEMPVMDGFQATRRIRQMEKGMHLPVIAMTANTLSADVERCRQAGMLSHIGKPIDPDVLLKSLLALPSAGASA